MQRLCLIDITGSATEMTVENKGKTQEYTYVSLYVSASCAAERAACAVAYCMQNFCSPNPSPEL